MLSIKKSKRNIPDLTEFTDDEGKKWVQTSVDDLLSTDELSNILDRIDKDKDKDEIVLARFNFEKVNKEYYETVLELEARLKKQNDILKKLLIDARDTIDKKNRKLKELIKIICRYSKIIGGDLVEVTPINGNNITEFLGASLIYKIIGYI